MQVSRRALLTLKPARSSRAGAAGAPTPASPDTESPGYWLHVSRRAMACRFEVTLPAELSHRTEAAKAALDTVDALEDQLSIFRDTSELSAINRDAGAGPVVVEDRLFDLLTLCHRLSRESQGAFDITSTPLSRTWGFLRRAGRLPAPEEISEALAHVGMNKVILRQTEAAEGFPVKTVRFKDPALSLNLGGIGKGYALDRMAEDLTAGGTETALLSAGASSFLAIGAGPDGGGYRVGIRDPFEHDRRYGTIHLANAALGVSGTGEQFFEVEGRRYGHILDPRSGWPVAGRALVAVTAPTATMADALATAFFVGGPAMAERYTVRHPEVSVLVIDLPMNGTGSDAERPALAFGRAKWRVNRAA